MAPDGTLMLEIPPNPRSDTIRIFIKPGIANGGDGRIMTLGIDAPRESVVIVKEPEPHQRKHYPDGGAGIDQSNAEVSRWEADQKRRQSKPRPKKSQDAKSNEAA